MILLELLTTALGAGGMYGGMAIKQAITSKPKKPKRKRTDEDEFGAVSWLFEADLNAYRCPKCTNCRIGKEVRSDYCVCPELPEGHYHYTCAQCQYKALMRTADRS